MAAAVAATKCKNERKKAKSKRNVVPGGEEDMDMPEKVKKLCEKKPGYVYPTTGFWKHQKAARDFYTRSSCVIFVAGLIVFNFFVSMAEKTVDPGPMPLKYTEIWIVFAAFFNLCFTIELAVNMSVQNERRGSERAGRGWGGDGALMVGGGYCCCGIRYSFETDKKLDPDHFWTGRSMSWNLFDLVVVTIGLLGYVEMMLPVALPSWLKKLRLMRAFRVFRLFKRVKSLNKIIVSLAKVRRRPPSRSPDRRRADHQTAAGNE